MFRPLASSSMFCATERETASAPPMMPLISALALSSLVSAMCSILPMIPAGSMSTGIIVT